MNHLFLVMYFYAERFHFMSGCVGGCDATLKQLIEICGTGLRNTSSMPGTQSKPIQFYVLAYGVIYLQMCIVELDVDGATEHFLRI